RPAPKHPPEAPAGRCPGTRRPAPIWRPPGPTHARPRPAPSGSYSVLSGLLRLAPRSLSDPYFITWGQYIKSGLLPQQTLRGTAQIPPRRRVFRQGLSTSRLLSAQVFPQHSDHPLHAVRQILAAVA
ncbi:VanZ like family, partial [Dysosmobacter welbionis]